MSVVHKITSGFTIQRFDENGVFIGQQFVAGDEVSYETESGDNVDIPKNDTNIPFDMAQPLYNFTDTELVNDCFDKLIAQGGCSMSSDGRICLYRGLECRKCAIGLYIPDSRYHEKLERHSSSEESTHQYDIELCEILRSVGIRPKKMIILQYCHDTAAGRTLKIEALEEMRAKLLAKINAGFSLENIEYNLIDHS